MYVCMITMWSTYLHTLPPESWVAWIYIPSLNTRHPAIPSFSFLFFFFWPARPPTHQQTKDPNEKQRSGLGLQQLCRLAVAACCTCILEYQLPLHTNKHAKKRNNSLHMYGYKRTFITKCSLPFWGQIKSNLESLLLCMYGVSRSRIILCIFVIIFFNQKFFF